MAQLTMYPAMSGSKRTELSSDITDADTSAPINDLAALPEAPNIVTFQTDETVWERCKYTAKSAASGTGTITIERSGDEHASSASGGALAWAAGTKVMRNPSGLDHDRFKANIEEHETRILAVESLDVNWSEVTGTTQQAAVNKGYIANNASLVTITLPATAAIGDRVQITGKGAGGWKIAQNASQYIKFGNLVSTTGTGGYMASSNAGDGVELVCDIANTSWRVMSAAGILDVV